MTPAWLLDIVAAIMLAVSAVSAARLIAARAWRAGSSLTDVDIAHLLMGIAMAGMLVSGLTTLPAIAWEIIFGLLTAWFVYRVAAETRSYGIRRSLSDGHCAPHLAHSAAMLYMFLAITAPASGGMGGMGGAGGTGMPTLEYPTLALIFALVLSGYSVWDIDRLSGSSPEAVEEADAGGGRVPAHPDIPSAASVLLSRGTATSCRIAMGVAMTFMLIIMI
ncbi:MAG TPA: DUF5134 domain-containing protein [Trebonia sp.]|jgi:hypothetical protein